jgi:hypothetical protein
LEASADGLAQLIDSHAGRTEAEAEPESDPITQALAAKTQRKRALALMLTGGRPEQPRDEHGRYATFDGGARRTIPIPLTPDQAHSQAVVQLANLARTFGNRAFTNE